jgi:hypothetical protein
LQDRAVHRTEEPVFVDVFFVALRSVTMGVLEPLLVPP